MLIRFHPDAEAELLQASTYYEAQQTGLGKRFLNAVEEALNKIRDNPVLYRVVEDEVRRCLVRVFPYGVLFRVHPEQIVIVAIMHLHRDPGYWKERRLD